LFFIVPVSGSRANLAVRALNLAVRALI